MEQQTTDRQRVRRASVTPEIVGDEIAAHVTALANGRAQAQISDPHRTWMLHVTGTPAAWRHLAKQIEDAAMEAERLIADEERAQVREHYGAMAEQSADEAVQV